MDTSLPIVGLRVAKVSFADVVPYLTLDLPARTAEDEAERPDYVLQIDGKLRFTASGMGTRSSSKSRRTQCVSGCYVRPFRAP